MSRNYRDISPINDHRGVLENHNGPHTLHEFIFSALKLNIESHPFVTPYLVCLRLYLRYPYTLSGLIANKHVQLVLVILYPCDLVTCLQALLI
jgi:hypothetical protein